MTGNTSNGATGLYRNGRTERSECRCPVCASIISPDQLASIIGAQKAREIEIEHAMEARYTKRLADAAKAKRSEIVAAVKAATTAVEAKLKSLRDDQAGAVAAAVEAERAQAAKKLDDAVATAKLEHAAERLRLESALAELQRKVQRKTPHDLGEPVEVALHSAITGAFTDEQCRASRVPRGKAGPDIIVEVLERGTAIGTVVIDCKNYTKWSSKFVPKLKSDARALSADWAVLASNVFPRDSTRGLCVVDGVIVSDPAYVVTLVEMLRRQIVELHRQRLTQEAHEEKAAAMLEFVASAECASLLEGFATISDGLLALDIREVTAHQTVWRKRGELIRSLQRAHESFLAAVDAIMNGEQPVIEEARI